MKRTALLAILAILALVAATTGLDPSPARAQLVNLPRTQPNLILIVTDDQRVDTMEVMPSTMRNFNVEFTNATVTTPLCCPSRATLLTGEYAHNHRVWTNYDYPVFQRRESDSLGPWLQARGYFTGFFGKYLNKYAIDDPTPPGWDEFYARVGDAGGKLLFNGYTKAAVRERYRSGFGTQERIARFPNREYRDFYMTDYLADRAVRFIERAENLSYNPTHKPWAVVIWTTAPHVPIFVAPRHRGAPVPAFRPAPSFMEADMRDKPAEVRAPTYQYLRADYHYQAHDGMLRMLMAVDDLVERVWDAVDAHGLRSTTHGVFTSDNGWFLGEHRKNEKVYAYEESARVPFRMAVPGVGRRTFDELVSNVDVAPTLMELAGDPNEHRFRGVSLVPLIEDRVTTWRDAVLIEARSALRYDAVRTKQWKLIVWEGSGNVELYDLVADPYEMRNVADLYPLTVAELRSRLDRLKSE